MEAYNKNHIKNADVIKNAYYGGVWYDSRWVKVDEMW